MKAVYIIISSLLAFLVFFVSGCGSTKPSLNKKATVSPKYAQSDADYEDAERMSNSISTMEITYENANGTIHMNVDPMDEDLYIDFRGHRVKDTVLIREQVAPQSRVPQGYQQSASQSTVNTQSTHTNVVHNKVIIDTVMNKKMKTQMDSANAPQKAAQPQSGGWNAVDPNMTDKVLKLISRAQQDFYKKNYEDALEKVTQSLAIYETAEAYALLGSIEYMKKNKRAAKVNWNKALFLDPEMKSVRKMLRKVDGSDEGFGGDSEGSYGESYSPEFGAVEGE